ncbi:MAG: hypothetical protein PWP51_692 [Clostridiales bacterium]|jgi:hypothetical protein|nr:hypothetical protein [Clostridiales bacterium]
MPLDHLKQYHSNTAASEMQCGQNKTIQYNAIHTE